MVLYAGIDLHSNNNVVVVQDAEDNVVGRRRLPNHLRTVCDWLEPFREELAGVVVESTYNWYWQVNDLPGCVWPRLIGPVPFFPSPSPQPPAGQGRQ